MTLIGTDEQKLRSMRTRVFAAAFVGYGAYYLVRTNLPPVAVEFSEAHGYDKAALGRLLSASGLAYGLGKFLLGNLADRGRARLLMPAGLLASAGLNVAFAHAGSWGMHLALWTANGFVQGMGFGPCGRVLTRWFGPEERGRAFGTWNVSHNLGGALVGPLTALVTAWWGWRAAFDVPALLCVLFAAYLLVELRDSPEEAGLRGPSSNNNPDRDQPRNALRLVLGNPWMWLLGLANLFGYVIRYALLDWGPTYLREARGATLMQGGASTFAYELAAVASTLGAGWLTDRLGGRRVLLSLCCLVPIVGALLLLVEGPADAMWLGLAAFAVVGFCVYPLLMLFTVLGVDLTTPAAVGTAVGFIGLFGYVGKALQAELLGRLAQTEGWNAALGTVFAAVVLEALLLGLLWRRAEGYPRAVNVDLEAAS